MKYRAALFSSAFCLVFVTAFFAGSFVFADQYGLEATASAADLVKETSVPNIIGNVIGAGLSLVTVLFFILMIYAGIKWMLARGDEGKAKEALDTIVAAIIGIIVVLAAYAITNFVFKSVGAQGGNGGGGTGGNEEEETPGLVYCIKDSKCVPQSVDDPEGCGSSMTYASFENCDNAANPKKWCSNSAKTDCISFPADQVQQRMIIKTPAWRPFQKPQVLVKLIQHGQDTAPHKKQMRVVANQALIQHTSV